MLCAVYKKDLKLLESFQRRDNNDGERCRGEDIWGAADVLRCVQPIEEKTEGRSHLGILAYGFLTRGSRGEGTGLISLTTATGSEGTVWRCNRGGAHLEKALNQEGAWGRLPKCSWHRACHSSRNIWKMLSGILSNFWVDLGGAGSWTW